MNDIEFHKKKNILFADIILLFNNNAELFYMLPDELINRMNQFLKDSKEMMKSMKQESQSSRSVGE